MKFISSQLPLIFFILSLIVLVWSVIKNARRFRVAVFFMITIIALLNWIFVLLENTIFYHIFSIILVVFIIFLVLIVPVLLIADGFLMIQREGRSLSNLLSLLFGIVILCGEAALLLYIRYDFPDHLTWLGCLLLAAGYTVFYVSVVFLIFMFYSTGIRWLPHRIDFDYIVVLGCGLINGDKVSRLLGNRLDKAVKVYNRSMSACKIICSGGKGADETISEAEAMKNYLLEKGISKHDIILEDKSTDTMENLINSQAIIQERKGRQFTAIVSSGYHILRADLYAARINFPAVGIGAHTALYYWPSAMIREYAALVRYYWRPYFLVLIVTCVLQIWFIFS